MSKNVLPDTKQQEKELPARDWPVVAAIESVGEAGVFFFKTIKGFFTFFFTKNIEMEELLRQCFKIGNKSLGLVLTTGFIMGLVLTLQSRPVLAEFGAESWLPSMVCLSFVREIGPVLTGLICAGKVGSGLGAEVASMKVTEQIEAMEVSATNPFKYIVVTRVIACTFMLPLLIAFSDFAGILGSYVGVKIYGDISFTLFFTQGFSSVEFIDIIPAIIKSVLFGFAIGFVGCYKGYNAGRGTESVGVAANSAVVVASLLIFFIDLVAVQTVNLIETFNILD